MYLLEHANDIVSGRLTITTQRILEDDAAFPLCFDMHLDFINTAKILCFDSDFASVLMRTRRTRSKIRGHVVEAEAIH